MCGRFILSAERKNIERILGVEMRNDYAPRLNIAPSQAILTVADFDPETITPMKWGMTPVWWKEKGRSLINIRVETLKEKQTFLPHLKSRRCVIVSDGFYEWDKSLRPSQPYLFRLKDGSPFLFPALWEKEDDVYACALVTVPANDLVGKIHERMPAILSVHDTKAWLDHETPMQDLLALLEPYSASRMDMEKVSKKINTPREDIGFTSKNSTSPF